MKLKIGVIFGGKSLEHEISIITALQAMEQIDKEKYEVIPIYIAKNLTWYASGLLRFIDSFNNYNLIEKYATKVNLINKKGRFILQTTGLIKKEYAELHLVIPMVHGNGTEDGTIQGYLRTIGIPFVSNNIYSSVICQDKVFTKQLLDYNDIPVIKYTWCFDNDYNKNKEITFSSVEKLKYPLIIKPATLGSSIGIQVVNKKEELDTKILEAFKYDRKIIIEEKISDFCEYNISILKTNDRLFTSSIEEVTTALEYRSFDDKYKMDNYKNGNIVRKYPADISDKFKDEIIDLAKKTTNLLNNTGLCTIDFLYDKKKSKLYVDEINNIPGCFSHHLWEDVNISYSELMSFLINDAIKNMNKDNSLVEEIDMSILKNLTQSDLKDIK